jgi:DNA-binding NtrC family response regulator
MMESMVVLSEGDVLDVDALPSEVRESTPAAVASNAGLPAPGGEAAGDGGLTVAEIEKRHIMKVLGEQGQNRTRAARVLGIGRRTLQRKLDEYREQGEDVPPAAPE